MSFVTLYTDEQSWLATDQRVFSVDEQTTLTNVVNQMQFLAEQRQMHCDEFQERVVEAEKRGFASGHAAGLENARQEGIRHFEQLRKSHEQFQLNAKAAIGELALSVVRRIAGNVAPEIWLAAQARQAVQELLPSEQIVRLRVTAAYANEVRQRLQKFESSTGDDDLRQVIEVVPDDNMKGNACTLETQFGSIDIDIDTQLESLCGVLSDRKIEGSPSFTEKPVS